MTNTLKWGLIGASRIASEWVIPAINTTPGNEVVAVQGGEANRVAAYARDNGIPQSMTAIDDLLAADIDAVYVSNTNDRHAPSLIAALAAGKHALGEKPMALSPNDAERAIQLAHRKGLILGVNHHLRGMNTHRKLRELVETKALGDLVAVRVMFGVLLPEANRGWRTESAEAGAGVFFDLSVHDADALHYILGEPFARVMALTSNNGISGAGIEDTVAAIAQTRSGLVVQITESFAMEHARTALEIHGTKASVYAEDLLLQCPGGKLQLSVGGTREDIALDHVNAYPRVIAAFADAVREGGRPLVSGEDGLASLRFALAARESARTGRVVEL